jgi:hypothetical protein
MARDRTCLLQFNTGISILTLFLFIATMRNNLRHPGSNGLQWSQNGSTGPSSSNSTSDIEFAVFPIASRRTMNVIKAFSLSIDIPSGSN